jgi:DNA-binding NarL/FixJ family response regulator
VGQKTPRERELEGQIAELEAQVRVLKEVIMGAQQQAARPVEVEELAHPSMFTPKQHAVIQAALEGWSTQRMAETLETTESTVKGHIKSVMDKLGVRTRAQMVGKTKGMLEGDGEEYERIAKMPVTWAKDGGVGGDRAALTTKTR